MPAGVAGGAPLLTRGSSPKSVSCRPNSTLGRASTGAWGTSAASRPSRTGPPFRLSVSSRKFLHQSPVGRVGVLAPAEPVGRDQPPARAGHHLILIGDRLREHAP